MRADQIFQSPLILPENIEPNTVYIPNGNDYYNGINDQFAFGDENSMEKYCSSFDNMVNIFNKYKEGYHTETYILFNIQYTGLNVKRFDLSYNLSTNRS